MNACQKSSGVSPKLINLIEEKVKNVNRIFNGTSKIVILSSTDEILYCNPELVHDNRTTKDDLQHLISNVKESCTRFSTGYTHFQDHRNNGVIHIFGKKKIFSVYRRNDMTLAFFTEVKDTLAFDTEKADKEMEEVINEVALLLSSVMKQVKKANEKSA